MKPKSAIEDQDADFGLSAALEVKDIDNSEGGSIMSLGRHFGDFLLLLVPFAIIPLTL